MQFELGGLQFELGGLQFEIGGLQFELGGLQFEIGGLQFKIGGLQFELGGFQIETDILQIKMHCHWQSGNLCTLIHCLRLYLETQGLQKRFCIRIWMLNLNDVVHKSITGQY